MYPDDAKLEQVPVLGLLDGQPRDVIRYSAIPVLPSNCNRSAEHKAERLAIILRFDEVGQMVSLFLIKAFLHLIQSHRYEMRNNSFFSPQWEYVQSLTRH